MHSDLFGVAYPDPAKSQPATPAVFPSLLPKRPTWQPPWSFQRMTFGQVSLPATPPGVGSTQPTSDAITQIQSEASLFPRAAKLASSVPPDVGSTATHVSGASSVALPAKPFSHESPKTSAVATGLAKLRTDMTVGKPASMDM
jgi:hypothetical protein